MYSINGVPLDNAALGWSLRATSEPLSGIVKRTQSLRAARHGDMAAASEFAPISLKLVVQCAQASLAALYALFTTSTLTLSRTADASRTVTVELQTASPEGYGDADAIVDATFVLKVPGAFWRAAETTSAATTLTSASQQVNVFSGISAPISDAIVRVKGAVTALQVTDAGGGSWFTFPAIPANQWLRVHLESGRAFLTTTDVWVGGTEVSGDLDFGGPLGWPELTPIFPTASDPSTRTARLIVASTARSGASVQVRARPAYAV